MSVLEDEGSYCDCCLSNDAEVLNDISEDLSIVIVRPSKVECNRHSSTTPWTVLVR